MVGRREIGRYTDRVVLLTLVLRALGVALMTATVLVPIADHHAASRLPESFARPETVFELYPIPWTKMEPIVMGMRRELVWPDLFDYFEKLGRQYQKWWEPKAKKIKLPEPPNAEARPTMRPAARPTLVQATRLARPGVPVAARPGAGVVKPAAKPAPKPAVKKSKPKKAAKKRR